MYMYVYVYMCMYVYAGAYVFLTQLELEKIQDVFTSLNKHCNKSMNQNSFKNP